MLINNSCIFFPCSRPNDWTDWAEIFCGLRKMGEDIGGKEEGEEEKRIYVGGREGGEGIEMGRE